MKNQQKLKPGQGEVVCEIPLSSKIRPVFSTLHASYPLKFLSPRTHSPSLAALYILTYGGGLVSGDSVSVKIDCKEGVNLLLLTQGSTKVYKSRPRAQGLTNDYAHNSQNEASTGNNTLGTITNDFEFYISASPDLNQKESPTFLTKLTTTQQSLHARIHQNSLLLQLPEPTTCFRSAEFKQRQRFVLEDKNSSLVVLDWFTSGRMSRGEKWEFSGYESGIDILLGERLIFRDVVLLSNNRYSDRKNSINNILSIDLDKTHNNLKDRLDPYECFATLVICGPKVEELTLHVLKEFDNIIVHKMIKPPELIWSASGLSGLCETFTPFGVIIKIAGITTEIVRNFLCSVPFKGLENIIGENLFERAL